MNRAAASTLRSTRRTASGALSSPAMPGATVTLAFPARAEYLRLLRLATADAGSRAGLDVEEIDDLKIAASEACCMVLGGEEPIVLTFSIEDDCVAIEGSTAVPTLPENELSRLLISAVVDEHDLDHGDGGQARFRLVKRHRP